MTGTTAPYRSSVPAGRDGFVQLLHAEWTKFRTVRGWVIGTAVAASVIVLLAMLTGSGSHAEVCVGTSPSSAKCHTAHPTVTLGPDGEPVVDSFYFVYQPLDGNGSITLRVTSLTGVILAGGGAPAGNGGSSANLAAGARSAVQPWAKAGIIVKASMREGSAYAAMMVTGGHGVRMQYDYTHDTSGLPGAVSAASPRWLRLIRSGATLTGYESAGGTNWTEVGTADLAGLPSTVQVGLFVASPPYQRISQHLGGSSGTQSFTLATATFDHISLQRGNAEGGWSGVAVGRGDLPPAASGGFHQSGGSLIVSGSGDIAPTVGFGQPIERALVGAFAGLIVMVVLAALFITAEYRRGLIRTTFAASPRRGRVLAAKALVVGSVAFIIGLVASAVALPVGESLLRHNGNYIYPVSSFTQLRVVVGTGALLAVAAVLALAVGTLLRRSAAAVTTVIVAIVLPYILSVAWVLPAGAADWLLRVTPAAAFAIQQSVPQYPQVSFAEANPANGYFPLPPWAGFAVLCAYAALALGVAAFWLRRRDA